jgi:cytochrome c oxidase subunit 1
MSQNHEHHHDHHQESFISKYIFSMDHKMIAKQYLITGMIMAVIAALISLLFRLQLGWPDQTFPWLESLLGDWGKGGRLDPNFYLALVTMHGTLMVFFVLACQCISTLAAVRRETRSWRWPLFVFVYTYGAAWVLSVVVYQLASAAGL